VATAELTMNLEIDAIERGNNPSLVAPECSGKPRV
jgi:hypothetical protein